MRGGMKRKVVLLLGCVLLVVALAVLGFFIIPMSTRAPFYTVFAESPSATSTLWAWGLNTEGQLGDWTTTNRNTPSQIGSDINWSFISAGDYHTVALKSDGTLWAWGHNGHGQLGDGTITDKTTPTQESTEATNWSAVSAFGYHTVALKSDGTLWAWGHNGYGELGDGTNVNKTIPTQESTGAVNWSTIAAGGFHTVALKSEVDPKKWTGG